MRASAGERQPGNVHEWRLLGQTWWCGLLSPWIRQLGRSGRTRATAPSKRHHIAGWARHVAKEDIPSGDVVGSPAAHNVSPTHFWRYGVVFHVCAAVGSPLSTPPPCSPPADRFWLSYLVAMRQPTTRSSQVSCWPLLLCVRTTRTTELPIFCRKPAAELPCTLCIPTHNPPARTPPTACSRDSSRSRGALAAVAGSATRCHAVPHGTAKAQDPQRGPLHVAEVQAQEPHGHTAWRCSPECRSLVSTSER